MLFIFYSAFKYNSVFRRKGEILLGSDVLLVGVKISVGKRIKEGRFFYEARYNLCSVDVAWLFPAFHSVFETALQSKMDAKHK